MKRVFNLVGIATIVTLLSACNDGSSSGNDARPDPTVSFSSFVQAQFRATSDQTDPVQINGVDFAFNDQNNEQAFDALLIP